MSQKLADYLQVEFEWTFARLAAGGVLSDEDEVAWTDRAMRLYRELSPEEQKAIDGAASDDPGPDAGAAL